jgi:GNAT superfamily N-acetyltransferase
MSKVAGNSRLKIRLAQPSDAGILARLRYQFRTELDPPVEAEEVFIRRCTEWMAQQLRGAAWSCWVAVLEDVAVGTLWLQLIEKLPNPVGHRDYHGYVTSVYVVPHLRNAGIGSALLQACVREAESRRLDALFLWPTERSRPLYQKHGFRVRGDLLERRSDT